MKKIVVPSIFDKSEFSKFSDRPSHINTPDGDRPADEHICGITYKLARPHIKNFEIGIDVGCRIGEFSHFMQYDFEHLYCFDPNYHPKFPSNVDMRHATHYNCALGDKYGTITMFGGMHTVRENVKPTEKACIPLDRFSFAKKIGLIKIDVEGFEEKVLKGAQKILEKYSPVIIVEQNHVTIDGVLKSAINYLESINYKVVDLCPRGWDHILVRE